MKPTISIEAFLGDLRGRADYEAQVAEVFTYLHHLQTAVITPYEGRVADDGVIITKLRDKVSDLELKLGRTRSKDTHLDSLKQDRERLESEKGVLNARIAAFEKNSMERRVKHTDEQLKLSCKCLDIINCLVKDIS